MTRHGHVIRYFDHASNEFPCAVFSSHVIFIFVAIFFVRIIFRLLLLKYQKALAIFFSLLNIAAAGLAVATAVVVVDKPTTLSHFC